VSARVTRLVTHVELREDLSDARQISIAARHEAVLEDGRRLLLLGDRGWTESVHGVSDIWPVTSVEEIEADARVVVGPDEPFDGRSQADMEADHWAYLAELLRQLGVAVEPAELRELPHDVVLGERLLARIQGA